MGKKVTTEIAEIRFAKPGTDLICPPPHHDIYSIEDLAQLIYDLKAAKPGVPVSVKLVAVENIGTIAVGVAKAGADIIEIDGIDGGTGAAMVSSKEHAGLPSEMGLAEAHQALVVNGLRKAVKLRVGGGIKNGHDVIKYALFGADEFSFGQGLMVSVGCIVCKSRATSRTARPGITGSPEIFKGHPEHTKAYLHAVAEEVAAAARADGLHAPLRDHRPQRPAGAADRPEAEAPAGRAARRVEVHPARTWRCRGSTRTYPQVTSGDRGVCGGDRRSVARTQRIARRGPRRDRHGAERRPRVPRPELATAPSGATVAGHDRQAVRPRGDAEPPQDQGAARRRGRAELRGVVRQRPRPRTPRLRPGRRGEGHLRRHGGRHARLHRERLRRRDPERRRATTSATGRPAARSSSAAGPGTGSASATRARRSWPRPRASTPAST